MADEVEVVAPVMTCVRKQVLWGWSSGRKNWYLLIRASNTVVGQEVGLDELWGVSEQAARHSGGVLAFPELPLQI